jgi:hypothetical protein
MARYFLYFSLTLAGMALFNKSGAQAPAVQQVIGAGGGSKLVGGYTIDFTVGETVIATAGSDPSCTEGFHQPLTARDLPDPNLINAAWYIKVYPNPVHGQLTIHTYMDRAGELDLRLVDLLGRVLVVSHFSFLQGYNDATINMGSLVRGVYVLSVIDRIHGGHKEFKLLKE